MVDQLPGIVFQDKDIGGDQGTRTEGLIANYVCNAAIYISRGIAAMDIGGMNRREDLPPTRQHLGAAVQQGVTRMNYGYILAFRPDFIHPVEIAIEKCLVEFRVGGQYPIFF